MSDIWKEESTIVRHGEKAMLVNHENEEAWIPYSQIHADSEIWKDSDPGETGLLAFPLWLAEKKGWV